MIKIFIKKKKKSEDSYFPVKNQVVTNDGNKNNNYGINANNNISRQNNAELASPLTKY